MVIMLFTVPEEEKEKAVQYLVDKIPVTTFIDVEKIIRQNGENWWLEHYFGFGMDVRNILRNGGFQWDGVELDELWVELVEAAVKKKFGT